MFFQGGRAVETTGTYNYYAGGVMPEKTGER
jgi:hypothetical protein